MTRGDALGRWSSLAVWLCLVLAVALAIRWVPAAREWFDENYLWRALPPPKRD